MAKPKTYAVPTPEDARAFINHYDHLFLIAASSKLKGLDPDQEATTRVYEWLRGLARDGWESKVIQR
jgi:hypothetical protein